MANFFTDQLSSQNLPMLFLLVGWSLIWKGIALWKAAKNNQKGWFVAIFLLNTFGILEMIYIFIVAKRKKKI
jgi:methionyl-tRNA synthetase